MTSSVTTATVVDRFIDGIRTGEVTRALYAARARLDATVPGWRFQSRGPVEIEAAYSTWFTGPSRIETLERHALEHGELVRYFHTFDVGGRTHAAHHVHILEVRDDLIVGDTVFCGGRWGPEILAEMGPRAHAG